MNHIYIVKTASANSSSHLEFAFHNLEEAKKFSNHLNKNIGASSLGSNISLLKIYDSAMELVKND